MTRKQEIIEAAREYTDKVIFSVPSDVIYFEAGAQWADEHTKSPWINAKNELPAKGGHYLCMDENHYISTLAFSGDKWVNSKTFSDVSLEVVKYWMPIPNLPKE